MRAMSEPDPELDPETSTPVDPPPDSLQADVFSGDAGPPPPGRYQPPPPPIRLFRSEELFGGGRIVWIEHAGATYRLQITARGKLILQK
jgi:hemin uptake protein HemP